MAATIFFKRGQKAAQKSEGRIREKNTIENEYRNFIEIPKILIDFLKR